MNKIRVAIVVPRGLDGKGGIERLFRYIASNPPDDLALSFLASRGSGSILTAPLVFGKAVAELIVLLFSRQVDIVHLNLSVKGSVYRKALMMGICRIFGAKVVVHYHGGGFDTIYDMVGGWISLTHAILRRATVVIALGDKWKRIFVEGSRVDPNRVVIIHNGVPDFSADIRREISASGPLRLCFAGEVGQRKGVDVLVQSLAMLKDVDWTCVIAGNGDREPFSRVIEEAGVGNRVTFTGWVSSDEVHQHMLESDVVLLPSRDEALPVALIEGAAAGTALIASNAGATEEIVLDGLNGFVVPVEPLALAAAIRRLADDRYLLLRMQQKSRSHYLQYFTQDFMAAKLTVLYRRIASGEFDQLDRST